MPKLGHGELEARIMDILWRSEAPMTPRDVHDVLARNHRTRLAYTTVMTILVRLWDKGMLDRQPQGRAFAYSPVSDRETWTAERMRDLLRAAGDGGTALVHFVQSMDAREKQQLRRALERRRR